MGWFKKSNDVIDLSERYRKQQERLRELKEEAAQEAQSQSTPSGFGIFGMSSSTTTVSSTPSSSDDAVDLSGGAEEKRRRLARRLMDMTDKIEDLTNQIYHLQQRIEVLEKKNGSGDTSGFAVFN